MTSRPRVLVTGASGFVGRYTVRALDAAGYSVVAAARGHGTSISGAAGTIAAPDFAKSFDAAQMVAGVEAVVHLAGIAHATSHIPENVYNDVNATAAELLAVAARDAGVRRFVFLSSVRAQTGSSASSVVTEKSDPAPTDAYGRSKLLGERLIAKALSGTDTRFTVLRPVLVYGRGVKGNMAALMRLALSPLPLPLGGFTARRSLISDESLAASIVHALHSPAVGGGTFLVADDDALSVAEIVAAMRKGLDRPPLLFSVGSRPVELALRALGRTSDVERLFGDLIVSADALKATGWSPVTNASEGLARLMREL